MYKEFVSPKSYDFISRTLDKLSLERQFEHGEKCFWVCYGSYVLNMQNEKSDLDLLYVHDRDIPVARIQAEFEGHPVTLYTLNRDDFLEDGDKKKYGGYFSGKVLNPHIIISKDDTDSDLALRVASEFIADFAATIGKQRQNRVSSSTNLVADTILARFLICPWYANYFMRYYTHPDFAKLLKKMEEIIPAALVNTGKVSIHKNGFAYVSFPSDEGFQIDLIKSVARFWSIGSYLHNSPHFLDIYIQKSRQYCDDPDAVEQMKLYIRRKVELEL